MKKKVFFSVLDKHVPCRVVKICNMPSLCLNLSEKQAMFEGNRLKRKA